MLAFLFSETNELLINIFNRIGFVPLAAGGHIDYGRL